MEGTAVTTWFGEHFVELHPLLQHLHCEGGGLTGLPGQRLAARLGLPTRRPHCEQQSLC